MKECLLECHHTVSLLCSTAENAEAVILLILKKFKLLHIFKKHSICCVVTNSHHFLLLLYKKRVNMDSFVSEGATTFPSMHSVAFLAVVG